MPWSEERAALCEHLERTRDDFTAAISGASNAIWRFRPQPDAWSVADVAEHVVIGEAEILQLVRRITAGPPEPARKPEVEGKDRLLIERVPVRRGRTPAPPAMLPTGRYTTPLQVAEAFLEGRSRTLRYIHTSEADLRSHFEFHPALKLLDAHQWLLMISVHTARHTAQIAEWKSAAEGKAHA